MGAKGSAMSRAIRFFKEADLEEATFVQQRAGAILAERKGTAAPKVARKAKSKTARRKPDVVVNTHEPEAA